MDIVNLFISNIGNLLLGFAGIFFLYNEKKKEAKLINKDREVDTVIKVNDTLQEENKRKNEDLDKKDALIEKLYKENGEFRDKNNELTTQNALLSYTKCTDENCRKRKPPRIIEDEHINQNQE